MTESRLEHGIHAFTLNTGFSIVGEVIDYNDVFLFVQDAMTFDLSVTKEGTPEAVFTPLNIHMADQVSTNVIPLAKDSVLLQGEPRSTLLSVYKEAVHCMLGEKATNFFKMEVL